MVTKQTSDKTYHRRLIMSENKEKKGFMSENKEKKGFGFGLGKMKELSEAFKKAQEVQEGAKKLQEELEELEVGGSAGEGLVKVFMSGNQQPKRVEISPDLLNKDAEEVNRLVTEAMQDAYKKSTTTMRERMEELTGGLNLPG